MTLVTVVLSTLLAAGPSAAPVPPAAPDWKGIVRPGAAEDVRELPPNPSPRDWTQAPPGSPEDQRLWTEVRDGTGSATALLGRVVQVAYRMKYGKYLTELDARRANDPTGLGTELRKRLERALDAAANVVPKEPGVYTCRHVLLDFEQRMPEPASTEMGRELPEVRGEARACATKLGKLVAAVGPAADELEASLAAIDAYLGRVAPQTPAGLFTAERAPATTERAHATIAEVDR